MHTTWIRTYTNAIAPSPNTNAKGRSRRGSFISPATTVTVSKPLNANTSWSIAAEKAVAPTGRGSTKACPSRKNSPSPMNRTSGTSFPIVSAVPVSAARRTPTRLTTVSAINTVEMTADRPHPEAAGPQK